MGFIKILKKLEICEENMEKTILIGQLTSVKEMLRKAKRRPFYPLISSLGVKIAVNIVNITKTPPYFHSRHEISTKMRAGNTCFVNNKKTLRRGLGSQC
ncbi:MAG TPA: hypothetical protein QGF44_01720 [Candidatus Nitrosopelagicus sp.]|nr:hypothetical protein [Candidatus Nitrosopelagicus sp.]HJM45674.1 hypothetical protein [Candidatus Nitrosopelagicus sp.]